MDISNKLLSDVTAFRTYSKYLSHIGRRETLEETINRNMMMHLDRFPKLSKEIVKAYQRVHNLQVMPSMRSMQFGGEAIIKNNVRLFNCSFLHMDDVRAFGEVLFLLLSGTGVGYSIQSCHISKLPEVKLPKEEGEFLVHDSIEGWSQALDTLMESYFFRRIRPKFNLSQVRAKGSYLVTTGARAPGPEPLRKMLEMVESRLKQAVGRKLTDIEVHDINCIISDCVLAGGIRRAAMISLFDRDSDNMLNCKHGTWWEKHPYRARANNSAVLPRQEVTQEEFNYIYDKCIQSNSGEPGFFWTNDVHLGTNPCKPLQSLILTPQGYITYEQALKNNKPLTIVRPDGQVSQASAPFKTGTKSVSRLLLSNGCFLYGTQDHLHKTVEDKWVKIEDLRVGDRLQFSVNKIGSTEITDKVSYEDGILMGWLWSDGWSFQRNDSSAFRSGLCFGPNEYSAISLLEKITGKVAKHHPQSDQCKVINLESDPNNVYKKYEAPRDKSKLDWIYGKSFDFKLGFIRAAFTADGSVRKKNNVEIYSIYRNSLEVLCNVLQEFGIYSTISIHNYAKNYKVSDGTIRNNKDCWKLNVYAGQFKSIGLLSKEKQTLLDAQVKKDIYRRSDYVTVMDIQHDFSYEDVYDITVYDNDHAYVDVGVTTHNCAEISLNSNQFCNLSTVNQTGIKDKRDFLNRVYAAALLGTLQASYTDFPYLRPEWKDTTEQEALLGVSFTGIADAYGQITPEWLAEGAKLVREVNEQYARKIGINPAARTTAIKPEGTASCVLGSSSGIHARHSDFYLRRIRMNKDDSLTRYLFATIPELVEDDLFSPTGVVVTFPQKSPANAITRENETAISLFERTIMYHKNWIVPGHSYGKNTHNVSVTISYKAEEVEELKSRMWKYRDSYTGISLLPYDGGTYQQAPFEDCSEDTYNKYMKLVKDIDLSLVKEEEDNTNRVEALACSGGVCEITRL